MIIVFSGTDGAGKSTQIDKLSKAFKKDGKNTIYLWSRGGYTPLFSFMKQIGRKFFSKKLPKAGQSKKRDDLLKNKSVSGIWLAIAIVDLILLYGIYVRFLSLTRKVVICDRYVDDTYLDFVHNFPNGFNAKSFLWRLLKITAPKPDHSFLLYVPVIVSQERSILKNEPFPDSEETLEFRLNNYMDNDVFSSEVYKKIECLDSIDKIHNVILKELSVSLK